MFDALFGKLSSGNSAAGSPSKSTTKFDHPVFTQPIPVPEASETSGSTTATNNPLAARQQQQPGWKDFVPFTAESNHHLHLHPQFMGTTTAGKK